MKIQITKEAKKWLTVAEMPEVRKMIDDFKEDTNAKDYAEMAAVLLFGDNIFCDVKILDVSAEITRNSNILNYYTDNSGWLDVLITFTAFNGYNRFVRAMAYLSDIWQIGNSDRHSEIKARISAQYYDLVK